MRSAMVTLQRWVWSIALVVAVCLFPQQSRAETPKLSLEEDTIRIPVGYTDGAVQVVIKAENLTDDVVAGAKEPTIEDRGNIGAVLPTTVKFENPVEVAIGTTNRTWLWTARIKSLPVDSSQKRVASFSFGRLQQTIEYTITNLPPADFTWSVAAPETPWVVRFGFLDPQISKAVVVTTGNYPASNFRLAQSTLQDGLGTGQIRIEDLELCETPTGPCGKFSINARTNQTFYVRLKHKVGQWIWQNGKYTGALSFAVKERPELQTVSITLQASSLWAKLTGAVVVAIGIYLAWWVSVWARARLLRLEALKPVAALRESVAALLNELQKIRNKIGVEIPGNKGIGTRLDEISHELTIEKLEKNDCLPPALPQPFPGAPDTSSNLKTHLDIQGKCVAGLTILVLDGMNKVLSDWGQVKQRNAIMNALTTLNEKGYSIVDPDDAKKTVEDALKRYYEEVKPAYDAVVMPPPSPLTMQHLTWEIAQLYKKGWLLWGALTFVIGLVVLVLINPGFGTSLDLVFCFLWGFGLPTSIEKLQQIGPGGIASMIGVNLPKVSP